MSFALSGCQAGSTIGGGPSPVLGGSPNPIATRSPGSGGTQPPSSSPVGAPTPTSTPAQSSQPTPSPTPNVVAANAKCPVPLVPAGVTGPPADSPGNSPVGKIKHIVIIIQENRPFDVVFHDFSEANGTKADTTEYGCDTTGKPIALQEVPFENAPFESANGHADFEADYDGGKNDGFYADNAPVTGAATANNGLEYLPQQEVQPYWDMATSGALAERFFHGVTGPTYPSHLMYMAASTTYDDSPMHRVIDNPAGGLGCQDTDTSDTVNVLDTDNPKAPPVFPCYSGVSTITDLLDAANHSWHYYSFPVTLPNEVTPGAANAVNSGLDLNGVPSYKQDYERADFTTNDITPSEQVLTDVASGTLEDVTWVTPDNADSDHPGLSTAAGPAWVESVVDAIGESSFYSSTAIFVTWDDWGGLYDHVPPPQKYAPYGLSFRIGCIALSPYARKGQLIDTQLEPGSIMRFIEETYGLPSLGREDATANSIDDMFDFAQAPTAFVPIASAQRRYNRSYFLHMKSSGRPLDADEYGPFHIRDTMSEQQLFATAAPHR